MSKTTTRPPRRQWGSSYHHQTVYCRPGFGVRVISSDPALRLRPRPRHLDGTKRGTVSGFSKESAARLRRTLFELDYPAASCFGLALTSAPWVKRRPEDAFKAVARHLDRIPGLLGGVWRKEVTRAGLSHYHLVVWVERPEDAFPVFRRLTSAWVDALLLDGICPAVAVLSGSRLARNPPPSLSGWLDLARASLQAVNGSFDLRPGKSRGNLVALDHAGALQYLCDHTSKHKAYQAKTTGRAWGVWNAVRLPRFRPFGLDLDGVPARCVSDVRRALGKMSRYWWRDEKAPFGYRWSHARRFEHGDQVLFRPGAVDALRRILARYGLGPYNPPPLCPVSQFLARRVALVRTRLVRCLADRVASAPLVHLPDLVEPPERRFHRP